jgi:glucokinase
MRSAPTFTIGVDVGGTKVASGLVDDAGQVIARERREVTRHDPESVADAIAEMVQALTDVAAAGGGTIDGLGVGLPGFVSADRHMAFLVPNLGWRDVPFKSLLEDRVHLPVLIDNDANVATWAEYRFGAGRGFHHIVMITVGTGIGGGLVVNDHLVRGGAGMAAEVGHLNLIPDGRPCGCGRNGCWEQYGSGSALVRYARDHASSRRDAARIMLALGDGTPEGIAGHHVTSAAAQGDPVAIAAFTELGERLGQGLVDLVAILDPQAIIVGGGVSEAGGLLLDPLTASLRSGLMVPSQREGLIVRLADLRNDAGIIGAADIVRVEPIGR